MHRVEGTCETAHNPILHNSIVKIEIGIDIVIMESKLKDKKLMDIALMAERLVKKDTNMLRGNYDKNYNKRKQISLLLLLNIKNFQKEMLANRRRSQQRLRRRHILLRNFFMKQMLQIQSNYLEMFSLLVRKSTQHNHCKLAKGICIDTDLQCSLKNKSEEEWLNNFRMTRRHFYWLCEQVRPALNAVDAAMPKSHRISLDTRVALSLYMLSHGEYRPEVLKNLFNVPGSVLIKYLKQFASALLAQLGHKLLVLPKEEEEFADIRNGFCDLSNNIMPPAAVGVMGVCTIPVQQADVNHCTKIRLEALVDDHLLFRKLQISSKPTPALFSELFNEITEIKPQHINGRMLPCFVLAPVGQNYPLRPWLLQRYVDPIAPHEYDFNEAADSLQDISEKALQRLFTRWQLLAQPFQLQIDTSALIITACCALHNLLEELGEPFLQEWADTVDLNEFMHAQFTPKPDACTWAEDALDIRDFLARSISSTEI